ncbi:MAG: hypothetical protein IPN95_26670 [Bacteroidetes bacterium]|nr:hypothetical protein [Bacteroidota bacterium]
MIVDLVDLASMKKNISVMVIFLVWFSLSYGLGQSPFNYGQNEKVYFVSAALRDTMGIETIYTVEQTPDGQTGGMGENWDVTIMDFGRGSISVDWYPISRDSSFQYDFDSLTTNMRFLNGIEYEFSDQRMLIVGGGGYGSFDHTEFTQYNDTISIGTTSCVGHCGDQPVRYSKNVFNDKGQLLRSITYPPAATTRENDPGLPNIDALETYLNANVTTLNMPDTVSYHYNKRGLLLNSATHVRIRNSKEAKSLFIESPDFWESQFHQYYVGNIEMEVLIEKEIGFLPALILIEIYRHGVFSFVLNPADRKYYRGKDMILEQ